MIVGTLAAPPHIALSERLWRARGWWLAAMSKSEPRVAATAKPAHAGIIQLSDRPDPGEARRFSAVMMHHLDAAYTFARYLTRGDAASEDLVHDAYVRAIHAYSGFRGGDAKAWIFAIVRNCFMTWAKARANGRTVSDDEAVAAIADDRTPEDALTAMQSSQSMRRLIEALPPQLAEIIVLREIEELSYREIAVIIEAPIGTVMSRLARAREQLARAWREGGAFS